MDTVSKLPATLASSEDCAWELLRRLPWKTSILHLRTFYLCAIRLTHLMHTRSVLATCLTIVYTPIYH